MKQKGLVLLFLLATISVLALLTLTQWQALITSKKMMNQYGAEQDRLFRIETAAKEIIQALQQRPLLESGVWQGFTYTLDFQGDFPCIHIGHASTAHYILKLIGEGGETLTCRVLKRIPLGECIAEKIRMVSTEVLSWDFSVIASPKGAAIH